MSERENKKINLLYIITGLKPGGAERVVFDLAKFGNEEHLNINVISVGPRNDLLQDFLNAGIETTALVITKSPIQILRTLLFLNNYVRKNNIDIIHAHMTHAMFFSAILKMFNWELKIVFTPHNVNLGGIKDGLNNSSTYIRRALLFLLKPFRNTDIIFSKDTKTFFIKSNFQVIPNGINTSAYQLHIPKNSKFTYLAIGRIEPVKNFLSLIPISKWLVQQGIDFEIWIAGNGHEEAELKKQIKDNHLENYFNLLGFQKDIPLLCNKCHAFILPSLWEGMPIVLLEAAASNLPIISTPVGAIPSFIDNNSGYLTDIKSFGASMLHVYQDYSLAKQKANIFHKKIVEEYDINVVVKRHESLYHSLIRTNKEHF